MCFNSYLFGMRVCGVIWYLSVDRECGKTLLSAGHYEKYSQFEQCVYKSIIFSLTRDDFVAFIF